MRAKQQSFISSVIPYFVDTKVIKRTPKKDCDKINALLNSYNSISVVYGGECSEIISRATIISGKCSVLLLSGQRVNIDDLEIVEDFGF